MILFILDPFSLAKSFSATHSNLAIDVSRRSNNDYQNGINQMTTMICSENWIRICFFLFKLIIANIFKSGRKILVGKQNQYSIWCASGAEALKPCCQKIASCYGQFDWKIEMWIDGEAFFVTQKNCIHFNINKNSRELYILMKNSPHGFHLMNEYFMES